MLKGNTRHGVNEAKAFYFILAAAVPKEAVFRKAFKEK